MGGHDGDMRAAARRDPDFRGIDPADLSRLIKNVQDASRAVTGWLGGHRPPPGVAATGYRQAAEVAEWADQQLGMLTRRHSYAVAHPDTGDGVSAPPVPPRATPPKGERTGGSPGDGVRSPAPPSSPPRARPVPVPGTRPTTPVGAGGDLGDFPDRKAAAKAARTDALAVEHAIRAGRPVSDQVWRRLSANAGDPDYTETLHSRLGPERTAALLDDLPGGEADRAARIAALSGSLGVASHHMVMDEAWLRRFFAQAELNGTRSVAVQVLTHADLSRRSREALAEIGPLTAGAPDDTTGGAPAGADGVAGAISDDASDRAVNRDSSHDPGGDPSRGPGSDPSRGPDGEQRPGPKDGASCEPAGARAATI